MTSDVGDGPVDMVTIVAQVFVPAQGDGEMRAVSVDALARSLEIPVVAEAMEAAARTGLKIKCRYEGITIDPDAIQIRRIYWTLPEGDDDDE